MAKWLDEISPQSGTSSLSLSLFVCGSIGRKKKKKGPLLTIYTERLIYCFPLSDEEMINVSMLLIDTTTLGSNRVGHTIYSPTTNNRNSELWVACLGGLIADRDTNQMVETGRRERKKQKRRLIAE